MLFSNFCFLCVLICLGEVPCNHEIMRDALSLIQRLPVMKTDVFREDFYNVSFDLMLKRLLHVLQILCHKCSCCHKNFNFFPTAM